MGIKYNQKHGCCRREKAGGMSKEYRSWRQIAQRCDNPKHPQYHNYGGRGIKMCQQWYRNFPLFFQHIGPAPSEKHQLDRIDNNGNYEPGNVRWSTPKENCRNKSDNIVFEHNGTTCTLTEHCERAGIRAALINNRIHNLGKSFAEALAMGPANVKAHGKRLFVSWQGERITAAKLAARFNIPRSLFHKRLTKLGWTVQEAIQGCTERKLQNLTNTVKNPPPHYESRAEFKARLMAINHPI